MSEESSARYRVVNERDQPVELYLGQQVVILPPRGWLELDEADLAAPQLRSLLEWGHISANGGPAEALAHPESEAGPEGLEGIPAEAPEQPDGGAVAAGQPEGEAAPAGAEGSPADAAGQPEGKTASESTEGDSVDEEP